MNVTTLQAQMLRAIALNEHQPMNGGEPSCFEDLGPVWALDIVRTAQDKGTFTSLMNAGLAERSGEGRDTVACLTLDGYNAYKAL